MDNKEISEEVVNNQTEEKNINIETENDTKEVDGAVNIFGLENEEPKEVVEETKVEEPKTEEVVVEETTEINPNAEVNGKEEVLYEYKAPKEYGPWPYLIFFLLVGGIIFFLPEIREAYMNYKRGNVNIQTNQPINIDNPDNPTSGEEVVYYDFNSDTVLSINKIQIYNLNKTVEGANYYITMSINNLNNSPYLFDDKIFIELYNDNKTLLNRLLLEVDDEIPASSSKDIRLPINSSTYAEVTKIIRKNIDPEDYSQVLLEENLKDQEEMNCSFGNKNILYTFKDYKLVSIKDTYDINRATYDNIDVYTSDVVNLRQKVTSFGLLNGVTATATDTNDGLSTAILIDTNAVSKSDLESMKERAYYIGGTDAKVVKFEMLSRGYTCK